MAWINLKYDILGGLGVGLDISGFGWDVTRVCDKIAKALKITQRAVPLAERGLPAPDDDRPTAIELDIRQQHGHAIHKRRHRLNRKLRRCLAGLYSMTIDVSEAEMKRIKAALEARLAKVLTAAEGKLRGLARAKVHSESALAGFRALNAVHDVPTARSAVEWFATTLATAFAEALVNAHLFKGEMGYVDAAKFSMGIGLAIAIVGVAGGIGWAQFQRRQLGRRIGGYALFAGALGLVGYFILGIAHYREALATGGAGAVQAALNAQAAMAATPLAPIANTSMLPYMILNFAGFALVCWKSVSMWGFLDLKRLERAAVRDRQRFAQAVERAITDCESARGQALDLLDGTLALAEQHVEEGNLITADAKDMRDAFKDDANAIAGAAMAREQEYRDTVEYVHPQQGALARFAAPPPGIEFEELSPEQDELDAVAALTARLMKVRDAMPSMTDEFGKAVDAAIARLGGLAVEAEEDARRNPRGKADNVFRFGK